MTDSDGSGGGSRSGGESPRGDVDFEDVLRQLDDLEDTVTSAEERREVRETRQLIERLPGSDRIRKYTSRDVAEGLVGGLIFALPLLVEDGVFAIAEWFLAVTVGPIPVLLAVNALFVVGLVAGLLYYTDLRDVVEQRLLGIVPERLVAVLVLSFLVAAGSMLLWGRLHLDDATLLEQLARISVVWTAAAFGAALGDILPGESKGEDLSDYVAELGEE
jgi:uncharacterized membrane protein